MNLGHRIVEQKDPLSYGGRNKEISSLLKLVSRLVTSVLFKFLATIVLLFSVTQTTGAGTRTHGISNIGLLRNHLTSGKYYNCSTNINYDAKVVLPGKIPRL